MFSKRISIGFLLCRCAAGSTHPKFIPTLWFQEILIRASDMIISILVTDPPPQLHMQHTATADDVYIAEPPHDLVHLCVRDILIAAPTYSRGRNKVEIGG